MGRILLKTILCGAIWLALLFSWSGGALANHQVDEIEAALSDEVGAAVEAYLAHPLSPEDEAYANFLIAVYTHDNGAREKAKAMYEKLKSSGAEASLGIIEIVKARDSEGGFFLLFKKKKWVQNGIDKLDLGVQAHPDDPEARILRAIAYLGLPARFGKLDVGFADIQKILAWVEAGKIDPPEKEPLFRDRATLYYYAGRYYLKKGEKEKAKKMFSEVSGAGADSPFSAAAHKRLAGLGSSQPKTGPGGLGSAPAQE